MSCITDAVDPSFFPGATVIVRSANSHRICKPPDQTRSVMLLANLFAMAKTTRMCSCAQVFP